MSASSSIHVAVRVRPFSIREAAQVTKPDDAPTFFGDGSLASNRAPKLAGKGMRRVVKVIDEHMLVFDPAEENPLAKYQKTILPQGKRVKDMRFGFDRVFDETCSQQDVYENTTKQLLDGVLDGFNSTVFAYGATGCGKTHTISGTPQHPGIIFLTCAELFERIRELHDEKEIELTLSYLEIYNETIRDLLIPGGSKLGLQLREDNNQNIAVAGLSARKPATVEEVMDIIVMGNANRTQSPTEANATSSRSHAVLQINVSQKPRTAGLKEAHMAATLSIIDLAGSERASVTKNRGERLLEGANINRSLLALGNCINALCDPARNSHIPYRDSKLTRLLKFSLGGNCKTVMIVCVSPASAHYDETHNTLKYANRAKNIKTKISRNIINVNRHVSQYVKAIYDLRTEVDTLKKKLNESTTTAMEKIKKQNSAKEISLKEGLRRLRTSFEQSREMRETHINDLKNLRMVERRMSMITAWLTAFDEVFETRQDEPAPMVLFKMRSEAEKVLNDLQGNKLAIQHKMTGPSWETIIDTALQNSLRSLQNVEGVHENDIAYLSCEANLMRMSGERDVLHAIAQADVDISTSIHTLTKSHYETAASINALFEADLTDEVVLDSVRKSLFATQTGISDALSHIIKPGGELCSNETYQPSNFFRSPVKQKRRPSNMVPPRRISMMPEIQLPPLSPVKASPRPHKVRTPKKAIRFPKSPGKKRVRFLEEEPEEPIFDETKRHQPEPSFLEDAPTIHRPAPPPQPQLIPPPPPSPPTNHLAAPPIRPQAKSRFDPGFLSKPAAPPAHEPLQLSPSSTQNRPKPPTIPALTSRPPIRKTSAQHNAPKRRSPSASANTSPSNTETLGVATAKRMVAPPASRVEKENGGSVSTVLSPRAHGTAGVRKVTGEKENRRMTVTGSLNLSSLAMQGLREQLKGLEEGEAGSADSTPAAPKSSWR